ncbi:MAG: hypothetical protein MR992_14255 [Lachnospiraceae bacterium]|nr:hypothetical protein [Lachnospiraceae bacterium]MDD7627255.1 hypothetical protein [Lachnospiraceae bacterium]MDY4119138.1 hypothetical protein [Lachnospiraceae bacterium]
MNDLLGRIYNDVLVYESDVVKNNKQVDEEINRLVKSYTKQLSDEELEKLNDLLSLTVMTTEQAGFENGVSIVRVNHILNFVVSLIILYPLTFLICYLIDKSKYFRIIFGIK